MYICLECGELFEEPKHYVETHNLDTPPYEEWTGCPRCGGAYTGTYRCECCEEWIDNDYIGIGDLRYCQNCYRIYELGEE